MNREEKIEFINLYFGSEKLHHDFDILEKAHEIFPAVPEEIEEPVIKRILSSLLTKRGLFPHLKNINQDYFELLKEICYNLFPQTLVSFYASYKAFTGPISYADAFSLAAKEAGFPEITEQHVMLTYTDLLFLFNARTADAITQYHVSKLSRFQTALDFLLLEKKYVSVRNFKLIHIHTFVQYPHITDSCSKSVLFLSDYMHPPVEKLFLYLITLLLLEGSDSSHKTVSEALTRASASESRSLYNQVQSLLVLYQKAGLHTRAVEKSIQNYNQVIEEKNV